MAPTIITGTESDANFPSVQTNQIDVDEDIMLLEGSKSLFYPIVMRTTTKAAHGQKKEWLEDEVVPVYTAAAQSFTTQTSFLVTAGTGAYFSVNDQIRDELTGESMLVTGVATDTLTVTRGWGSVASTSSSGATDGIIRLGNVSPQGASYPTIKDTQVVGQYNYQQISRKSLGLVNTATKENFRGENDPLAYKQGKALLDIVRQTEMNFFMGRRNSSTAATSNAGTQSQLSMGGVLDYITTNVSSTATTLTQDAWETWLTTKAFAHGDIGGNKLVVCSPIVAQRINAYPRSNIAPPSTDINKWGLNITKYQFALGTVDIFVHPDWRQFAGAAASNTSLGGTAICLDMSCIYMSGLRPLALLENRQNPGDDQHVDEYLQELTMVFKQERRHAKITGVTAP